MAHRLLHGIAHFFVQLRSGRLAGPTRFIHNLFRAVRGLLHDFLHRRFGHAVHRDFDGFLHGFVQLHIELLPHHRHLFGDSLFRAAPQSLVQRFLRVGHHPRHLLHQRRLRISGHDSSRRWSRHHMNLAISRRASGRHRRSRGRNRSLCRRARGLSRHHRWRSWSIDRRVDRNWFGRRWRWNLKWWRLDPFFGRSRTRYRRRPNRRQRLWRNPSHRLGRRRRSIQ